MKRGIVCFAHIASWFVAMSLGVTGPSAAQTCSVGTPSLAFAPFSPIAGAALTATGTIPVSCTWPLIAYNPNVKVCLILNAGQPLALTQGNGTINFGLYVDPAFASAWGNVASNAIAVTMTRIVLGGTVTQNVNVYARIPAAQTTVPTSGNGNTVYSRTFATADTAIQYAFYGALSTPPACGSAMTSAAGSTFTANVTVINSCTIAATNITFATQSSLASPVDANGLLTVQCTNNDAFRIGLNGGLTGTVTARRLSGMTRMGVTYQLYLDSKHATAWGDGTSGTSMYAGTGTGVVQFIPVYAEVATQITPAAGTYTDTITATIQF